MFHSFDYLKYWIHTNIVHINHNMKFMGFCYKPMKLDKFMTMWYLLFNLELGTCQHFNDKKNSSSLQILVVKLIKNVNAT